MASLWKYLGIFGVPPKRYIRDGWIRRFCIVLLLPSAFACSTKGAKLEAWPLPEAAFSGPFGQRLQMVALAGQVDAKTLVHLSWRGDSGPLEGWRASWRGPDKRRSGLEVQAFAAGLKIEGGTPESPGRYGLELHPPEGWSLEAPSKSRRGDGLVLWIQAVEGPGGLPILRVSRAFEAPVLDGRLDEAVWARPPVSLRAIMGGPAAEGRGTEVRLAWDEVWLYVAFDALDPEISERFENRDDPIYEHEAVELFLMPRRDGPYEGPYFELQASPGGIQFDASFVGPRRGMDRSFDAPFEVGTGVDGRLDGRPGDRRWISEWRIPWTAFGRGPAPRPGEVWRANMFRIDRSRGRPDDYQAWSPPMAGDFHRTEQFGFLEFVGGP